jgi:polar amino acid transport system substrate-binding protein
MTLKTAVFAAAALLGVLLAPSVQAQELELVEPGKLMVATEGTYAPFSMTAPDGTLDGLEIRVGKEIAKRLGLE